MSKTTDELEEELPIELKHTLKLVPQSQRELFVSELARYIEKRDKRVRLNEHHIISGTFSAQDLINLQWSTVAALKRRQDELKK
jgi:hypothetical protein